MQLHFKVFIPYLQIDLTVNVKHTTTNYKLRPKYDLYLPCAGSITHQYDAYLPARLSLAWQTTADKSYAQPPGFQSEYFA